MGTTETHENTILRRFRDALRSVLLKATLDSSGEHLRDWREVSGFEGQGLLGMRLQTRVLRDFRNPTNESSIY